jgi:hypothetical protein
MRKSVVFCVCFLLASCAWFESRESKTKKLVEAQLEGIDWNDVDQYPLFEDCDETAIKEAQHNCFQETLLRHFSQTLDGFEFLLADNVEDTLYMDFLVDREGGITVLDIEQNNEVAAQIPEFNGVVTQSLKSLPPVAPALKRGIPVNAKFRIPLILNTN